MKIFTSSIVLFFLFLGTGCQPGDVGQSSSRDAGSETPRWFKGNLHTHSLWSDGDDFPENIMEWYKSNNYDFVALSDHNILAEGEKWVEVKDDSPRALAYEKYLEAYGDDWVEEKEEDGVLQVRLKTLEEYRTLFEETGSFLIIRSEEISDRFEQKPVHVNATNIQELIEPQGGGSVLEVMQNNVDAVLEQRERTGHPILPHINHPNFGWAITAEDLIALQGERFFEVYNGHPLVHNEGDSLHPGTEQIWDMVLTGRLSEGGEVMYGLATDDAHNYHEYAQNKSNPGRGWVMVRAEALTPDAIISALEEGDFYATSGVELEDVTVTDDQISIRIRPEEGVTYRTQFIGTISGVHGDHDHTLASDHHEEIGTVLAEVEGLQPVYSFTGDELYVRATVISSRLKQGGYRDGEYETAWTQPVLPAGN